MNTRSRGKREQDAAPAAVPAKRRRGLAQPGQKKKAESHEPEEIPGEGSGWSQESTGIKPHWIGSRRGAPPTAPHGTSEPPTPARPSNQDTEDDDGEGVAQATIPAASQDDDEIVATRCKVMRMALPNLASATDNLLNQFNSPQRGSALYQQMLQLSRDTFYIIRKPYEEPLGFPFIDIEGGSLGDFGQHTHRGALTLGCANLASALNIVEMLQSGGEEKVLDRLAELDDFFYKLFVPFDNSAPDVALPLGIRALRFIETMAESSAEANFLPILASIFCEPFDTDGEDVDYPALLTKGPHRPLGGRENDEVEESLWERIKHIFKIFKSHKKRPVAINKLRESFPQEMILRDVRDWILSVYNSQLDLLARKAEEEFHDAEELINEDYTESEAESQPIIRASDQQMPSFFKDETSLRALDRAGRRVPLAPPSNRQQQVRRPASTAPSDYHDDDTNRVILGSPPPSSVAKGDEQQEEGDEDDGFEKDGRAVDKRKAATISHILQSTRTALTPAPSSSMPPPPRPSYAMDAPSSTATPPTSHLDALREEKRRLTKQHRDRASASAPWSSKQRHFWSDHDTSVLVRLIQKRQAAWSLIEKVDNAEFEHPRHQQAYRDKARNLKVDYLMTDAVLPPSFDLVTLGRKEIDRLISYGKNPYRKEKDIDGDGNAIKTEYVAQQ